MEYAGDELDRIIPPTSRRHGEREKKKESVLDKIRRLVEVFVGIYAFYKINEFYCKHENMSLSVFKCGFIK